MKRADINNHWTFRDTDERFIKWHTLLHRHLRIRAAGTLANPVLMTLSDEFARPLEGR